MKGVVDFYTELWDQVTGKMLPWFKWTVGIVVYAVVSLLIPPLAVIVLVTLGPLYCLFWALEKAWVKIKPFFFKAGA